MKPLTALRQHMAVEKEPFHDRLFDRTSRVADADRADFDRWYETEHLLDAKTAFRAQSAFRGWSDVKPGLHIAIYEFPDLAKARSVIASDEIQALIAEFDRVWQNRVPRTREIVEVKQTL